MKRNRVLGRIFILILWGFWIGLVSPLSAGPLKKTVGVADFKNTSDWREPWDLSRDVADILSKSLEQTQGYVVHDRKQLAAALKDLNLPMEDESAQNPGEPGGRYIPVQILVTGNVTDFVFLQGRDSGGIGTRNFWIGGEKEVAFVSMVIRLMDTTTGEILDTKRVEGRGTRAFFSKGADLEAIPIDGEEFQKTPIGKALGTAIENAVRFIRRKTETLPFRGRVLTVREGLVYTDSGKPTGAKAGWTFQVLRYPAAILDPETGLRLSRKPIAVGEVTLDSVKDQFATGKSDQAGRIARGDIIESPSSTP